ncbi:1,4-dihydroxy-2-naphthoate octaprenyltransferase [Dongshaea marina]|uniref:1,4-dihydroxy-2-naphthoate octaprenyltransferase n=1 Tax=Dongshaea marina TaxID=2047966 RepID=UPI000D3ECC45|nr:1,4-dihydroxy-2-naphthoate octaprenyltransferase [Dongshaea marina]
MDSKISVWLLALRPQTLLVSLSSILVGGSLAVISQQFEWAVFVLAMVTAMLLQILSNFANDYGDAVSGADNEKRQGPTRVVSSGLLNNRQMLRGIVLTIILVIASGLWLLYTAFAGHLQDFLWFMLFGGLAVIASITYTMGKSPYGYLGLGDLSVFIFFGLLGVLGSQYLFTYALPADFWLPAISCGCLATAVLNINNIRDIRTDAESGKVTLAVRLGRENACRYHYGLIVLAAVCSGFFLFKHQPSLSALLLLIPVIMLLRAARVVQYCHDGMSLNRQLKRTAQAGFLFNLLFVIALLVG